MLKGVSYLSVVLCIACVACGGVALSDKDNTDGTGGLTDTSSATGSGGLPGSGGQASGGTATGGTLVCDLEEGDVDIAYIAYCDVGCGYLMCATPEEIHSEFRVDGTPAGECPPAE